MVDVQKILIVQLGDVGDVVLTTPTIRAVKETYPHAHVSILVRKPFGSILLGDPFLNTVIETEKIRGSLWQIVVGYFRFVCQLRRAAFNIVVDLRTGDRGAILSLLSGARERVGRPAGGKQFWHAYAFTRTINGQAATDPFVHPGADQSLRLVRELGIDTTDSMPKLYPTDRDVAYVRGLLAGFNMRTGAVWMTINPFSRWNYKEWDPAKWCDVIDRLWKRFGIYTILVGSPDEAAACGTIVAGREDHVFSTAGTTSLSELAALISISAMHIGVDSAAPHIAAAVGTPTVTIHGPSDWQDWRVADGRHKIICPKRDCVPCRNKGCDNTGRSRCLEELTVDEVVKYIEEIIPL